MTLGTILAMLVVCTAAPPYDDCDPAIAAARANPDTRLVVENIELVFSDPELYARVRDGRDDFWSAAARGSRR